VEIAPVRSVPGETEPLARDSQLCGKDGSVIDSDDVVLAHKSSSLHRAEVESSEVCGCFYCRAVFGPSEIEKWIDRGRTAVCPRCGTDSVIGSGSGWPVTAEFLQAMNNRWFAQNPCADSSRVNRRRGVVVAVAALSTIGAFVISVSQQETIGDDPVLMLVFGSSLAMTSGALSEGDPFHIGFAAMAGFPAFAVVDLVLGGDHSLLPVEFAFYAGYGLIGVAAAALNKALRHMIGARAGC
jgi:hypothetical protein